MEKAPAQIKEFSKESAPEERKRIAGEIRAHREKYFYRKGTLTAEIYDLASRMKGREGDIENIAQEITDLESELAGWRDSIIQKLLHHFQIPKYEKEIRDKSEMRDAFESEYEVVRSHAEELHEEMSDKSELEATKSILKDFYQEQWTAYEEDRQIRDVGNISKQYAAVFVHGIHPNYIPQVNSLLNEWVDWKTKLKILLTLGPTISSSTMRKGESGEELWARMGVILSGGSVKTADARDAATRAEGLKKRTGWSYQKNIRERIGNAITQKRDRYNELTVENPDIAGFFINTDEISGIRRSNLASVSEIIPFIKELGMPLYAMRDGELYETEYNERGDGFVPRDKIFMSDISSRKFQLDALQKEKILEEILGDSPFKIKSPEVGYIHSRAQGEETYIEINVPRDPGKFSGEDMIYHATSWEPSYGLDGKGIKVIAQFFEIGSKVQYIVAEKKVYRRREEVHTKKVSVDPIERFDRSSHGYISIGFSTHNLGRPVTSNEAYLLGMKESIEKLKQERGQYQRKDVLEFHDDWIRRLAFHLYGFGEQAEVFGDITTKERAFMLAEELFTEDDYHDVVRKRIDAEGRFRINTEDLP